jgi:hypothetical protein
MEHPFLDKNSQPTIESLEMALGTAFPYYRQSIELASTFVQDWNFSKSSGWMLKVHDKKKALFYLIPLHNAIKIGMTIRESEKQAFLEDTELSSLHNEIIGAKKYSEGFGLQWDIIDEPSFTPFQILLLKLIKLRK